MARQRASRKVLRVPGIPGEAARQRSRTMALFAFPFVLFTFVFSYLPMVGIIIAFKSFRYDLGFLRSPWVGLANFEFFFTSPDAWRITRNTVAFNAVFIATSLVAAVLVAVLLFEIRGKRLLKAYQTILFVPYFLSWVVVAYMVYAFLNTRSGILNVALGRFGAGTVDWYNRPGPWIVILPVANLWKGVGMNAIIYYAALVGVDPQYFEAAAIEGASKAQTTRWITLPFLVPLVSILTVLAVGSVLSSDFGLFYQLPMDSSMLYAVTDVIDTYVYRALVREGNIGMSSAAGLYKSVVGFLLVITANAVVRRINPENSLF